MTQSTDDRLRIEAAQRDPSRFGDLYEENFYRVYAYVARRVGHRHEVEDLTADVFREALAGIGKFEWRGVPFEAWLLGIAARIIADYFRRSGREAGNPAAKSEASSSGEVERSAILFQLVERLPEAQFRVIHMRFVEQKSIREMARELARSEGAVKQLQLRAIESFPQISITCGLRWRAPMPDRSLVEQLDRAIESELAGALPAAGADAELAALAEIAGCLCDLPAETFKIRLKAELQRRAGMTTTVAGVSAGFRTIAPFIIHDKAPELVDFMKGTFGAEELKRNTAGEAYGFYSEVRIGDSVIMIGGGAAARMGNLPSVLHVYVKDCDATYWRALEAGAVTLMGAFGEPSDRPYGERSAFVQDAFGNHWYIATRLASAPTAGGSLSGPGTVLPYVHPAGARNYIDFLDRAFGAKEMAVIEDSGRVMHATVHVGDAVLEMGEAAERTGIPSNGLFLFVEDVEAAYARALAAGATAVRPPQDIPYGSRSGIVKDPEGYLWWLARWI